MTENLVARTETTIVNAITHSGVFHADEVFATVILMKYFNGDICVGRFKEIPEKVSTGTIVYDIGGGKYDHHQRGGNGKRLNGVPYSSAGLIWKDFGKNVIPSYCSNVDYVWEIIDRDLIQGIDAVDNGVMPTTDYVCRLMSISGVIASFNPTWNNPKKDSNDCFEDAVEFAERVFDNVLEAAIAQADAETMNIIDSAIVNAKKALESEEGRRIMVLPYYVRWQEPVLNSKEKNATEILYVVFPSNRGGYNCQCVPEKVGSFISRKLLPFSWRGISADELRKVTNVATATFCHPGGFICGAETLEDAIKLAKLAACTEQTVFK